MRVDIPREMFKWARERANMDVAALVKRFPQLTQWEGGDAQPTLKQLERFAKATYAPIGFFFLKEPPPLEPIPIPDFRTVANQRLARPSPNLLDTVYICQQRQNWYHDYARAEGERPLPFVGSARVGDDEVATATRIRQELAVDITERQRMGTWTQALRRFVEQAETLGVLVMISGVVGNNTRRKLNPDEFRGFALTDALAPLVFVNGADSKSAQMFTLAHELTHIWIDQSALSDVGPASSPANDLENWCNRVAAELLVPLEAFRATYDADADLSEELDRLARHFKVSTLVVLRRIRDLGTLIGEPFWRAYRSELDRLGSIERDRDPGGDFYRTEGVRVSKRFARALIVSALEGQTLFSDAYRLLGISKSSTFDQLGESLGVA